MNDIKRYVDLAFIFAAMIMSWFFMKFSESMLAVFSVTDTRLMGEHVTISTISGIVLGVVVAVMMWRNARIHEGAVAVASEMKKVTWPTSDETKYAMVVVVVMSVIVSAILFLFDFCSKQLTDLILGI